MVIYRSAAIGKSLKEMPKTLMGSTREDLGKEYSTTSLMRTSEFWINWSDMLGTWSFWERNQSPQRL